MEITCQNLSAPYTKTDEELILQSRHGNSRAVEQLLAKYRPLVESKARSYYLLGADHDDVVQEGMIGLYKAIRDFRGDRRARFRPFADLCITRQIITAVKMATRQKHLPLNAYVSLHSALDNEYEMEAPLLDCLPDTQPNNPETTLFQTRERDAQLEAARHLLSTLEMQVLNCYLEGKSYREMSDELQCPPKAVDNALQRVKRKIGSHFIVK